MALTKEDRKKNALIGNIERSLNAIKEAGKEADFYESISKVEFEQKTIEERFSIVKNYRESNGIKLIREVKDKKDNISNKNKNSTNINLNLEELLSFLPTNEDNDTDEVKIIRCFAKVSKVKKELDDLKLQHSEKENEYNMLLEQLYELRKLSNK
ncbi:hypothetical protein [Bacteroides sp.]|uniref:hypothetical protein n=1 Tax=Bacteroides sp. TaxID=29523 RepID=UPI002629DAE8|nr:hypothetical protein [Bacteroides sp.]